MSWYCTCGIGPYPAGWEQCSACGRDSQGRRSPPSKLGRMLAWCFVGALVWAFWFLVGMSLCCR